MIDTLPAHEVTIAEEDRPFSVSDMITGAADKVSSAVSGALTATGDKIAGAYQWTKGEIKGAGDYTTGKATSLLWTVAIAGAVVLTLYIFFKREVLK